MTDIVWKTVSLPNGYVGEAYEAGLAQSGAATAFTASAVVTGTLPPGIVLNADHVRLTGTPTTPGDYTFTLSMTDTALAVTSGTLTIHVDYPTLESDRFLARTPMAAQVAKLWH